MSKKPRFRQIFKICLLLLLVNMDSCTTFKRINKKDEPVTPAATSKIRPGKMHLITMKSGQKLYVQVNEADDQGIRGTEYYRDSAGDRLKRPYETSFQNLEDNAALISVFKVNPLLTAVIIVVPVVLFLTTIAVNKGALF